GPPDPVRRPGDQYHPCRLRLPHLALPPVRIRTLHSEARPGRPGSLLTIKHADARPMVKRRPRDRGWPGPPGSVRVGELRGRRANQAGWASVNDQACERAGGGQEPAAATGAGLARPGSVWVGELRGAPGELGGDGFGLVLAADQGGDLLLLGG